MEKKNRGDSVAKTEMPMINIKKKILKPIM